MQQQESEQPFEGAMLLGHAPHKMNSFFFGVCFTHTVVVKISVGKNSTLRK